MITLLKIKKIFKKCWLFLKHNWYVPVVLIYTLVLWLLFRKKDEAHEILKVRSDSYEAQIEAINKSHKEEIEKRDKILEKYDKIIKEIEKEYETSSNELDRKKKKEIKTIVKEYHDKPGELARLLAEKYGFEYTE